MRASSLFESGESESSVQRCTGHKSSAVQVYNKISEERKKDRIMKAYGAMDSGLLWEHQAIQGANRDTILNTISGNIMQQPGYPRKPMDTISYSNCTLNNEKSHVQTQSSHTNCVKYSPARQLKIQDKKLNDEINSGEEKSQIINEKDKILENQAITIEEEEPERKLNHTKQKVSKVIQKKKHKFSNHTKPITISNLKSQFNSKVWANSSTTRKSRRKKNCGHGFCK